jgi:Sortase domain
MALVVAVALIGVGLSRRSGAVPRSEAIGAIRSSPDIDPVGPQPFSVSDIGSSGASLVIPAVGTDAPLVAVGAVGRPNAASLTVPSDVSRVGWWDGAVTGPTRAVEPAPKPGQPGVAIIAGHVDSAAAGPGALYGLKNLRIGDAVQVVGSDGRASAWTVTAKPETTRKSALPPSLFVTSGPPRLALVTCGGPFDAATGHYLDNVIVWAAQTGAN